MLRLHISFTYKTKLSRIIIYIIKYSHVRITRMLLYKCYYCTIKLQLQKTMPSNFHGKSISLFTDPSPRRIVEN